jgi:hypothetical protein
MVEPPTLYVQPAHSPSDFAHCSEQSQGSSAVKEYIWMLDQESYCRPLPADPHFALIFCPAKHSSTHPLFEPSSAAFMIQQLSFPPL